MAAQYGAMVKRMHAGRAAQSGLYGALLAEAGFTGIVDVFESQYGGFCTTFSRSHDRFRLAELTAGLGERFETMGVALKFYSCVGSNHTALDAIRAIAARRPFRAGEVEKIVVHGSQATARSCRLALPAAGADLGADEPAVLRRDSAPRGRRVCRSVLRKPP